MDLGQGKKVPEKVGKKRVIYCEDSDDERYRGPIIGEGSRNMQKIRKMIQKHFLSGFPWSITTKKEINFDFVIIQRLANWKRGLENSLGDRTLGQAY